MAWTFIDLRYGWRLAAGITLAATTIYVADNARRRVNQADTIEILLGVAERCLATQYQTNPLSYHVPPPEFARAWVSNAYGSGAAAPFTNWVTNAMGWRVDRAMLAACDDTIRALVPWYADPESVGTTNPVMLTVTGLWARLGIGDGTNQFAREGYGERIHIEDLEERYKVLHSLRYFASGWPGVSNGFPLSASRSAYGYNRSDNSFARWYQGWSYVIGFVEPYWPEGPAGLPYWPDQLVVGASLWDGPVMIGGWYYEFISANWRQQWGEITIDWSGYPFAPVVSNVVTLFPAIGSNAFFTANGIDTNALVSTNWDGRKQTIIIGISNALPALAWPPFDPPYPLGWNDGYVPAVTYFNGMAFTTKLYVDMSRADTNSPAGTNLADNCFHYCTHRYW